MTQSSKFYISQVEMELAVKRFCMSFLINPLRRMVFLPLVFGKPIPTKMVGKVGAFWKRSWGYFQIERQLVVVVFCWFGCRTVFLFWITRFLEFRDLEQFSWLKSDNLAIWKKTHQVQYTEFHLSFSLIQSSIVAEIACLGRFAACRCIKTF